MFYLLTIDIIDKIDDEEFKKKLNLSFNWMQIMPNVFIIKSNKDEATWYNRFKLVLKDNSFFLVKIEEEHYIGWIHKRVWNWIDENKNYKVEKRPGLVKN